MKQLSISFIERLTQNQEPYKRDDMLYPYTGGYNPFYITKLVENYRSHPLILEPISRLFYNGDLIPKADEVLVSSLLRWEMLPTRGFPLLFTGVEGEDQREEQSPSWFNQAEITQVMQYIKSLLEYSYSKVRPEDIGMYYFCYR
jgi:putative helicase MOV10L1